MKPEHPQPLLLNWPLRRLPTVRLAGQYAVDDRAFSVSYFSPNHALQFHDCQGRLRMDETEFEILPGDVTLTPAGVLSILDITAPGQTIAIHFDPCRPGKQETAPLPLHLRLGPSQPITMYKMMAIVELFTGKSVQGISLAAASVALQDLLLWLALQYQRRRDSPDESRPSRAVDEAAAYLTGNLQQECNIPEIARMVGLSQNYLAHFFHQRFGTTMRHYHLMRRIEHAQYLLTHTNLQIKAIGVRIGLPDPQHFNKLFRKLTGQSPSAARTATRRSQ